MTLTMTELPRHRPDHRQSPMRLDRYEPATPASGVRSRGGGRALTCGNARHGCRDCGRFAGFTDRTLTTAKPTARHRRGDWARATKDPHGAPGAQVTASRSDPEADARAGARREQGWWMGSLTGPRGVQATSVDPAIGGAWRPENGDRLQSPNGARRCLRQANPRTVGYEADRQLAPTTRVVRAGSVHPHRNGAAGSRVEEVVSRGADATGSRAPGRVGSDRSHR